MSLLCRKGGGAKDMESTPTTFHVKHFPKTLII